MLHNGEIPTIVGYPFNSSSKMIVNGVIDSSVLNKYLELNTEVEYTNEDGDIIIGIVKSYNSIFDTENKELVEIPVGSTIKILSNGFTGTTVQSVTEHGNNIDILYDATDVQIHSSISNVDGFTSTDETDIIIENENTIILTPQSGIIDGLSFYMNENISFSIDAGTTMPRIDLVVLEKNQYLSTLDVKVKKGIAAIDPVVPSITQTTLGFYELPIMSIYVNASQVAFSSSSITDLRNFTTKQEIENFESSINDVKIYMESIEQALSSIIATEGLVMSDTFDTAGTYDYTPYLHPKCNYLSWAVIGASGGCGGNGAWVSNGNGGGCTGGGYGGSAAQSGNGEKALSEITSFSIVVGAGGGNGYNSAVDSRVNGGNGGNGGASSVFGTTYAAGTGTCMAPNGSTGGAGGGLNGAANSSSVAGAAIITIFQYKKNIED